MTRTAKPPSKPKAILFYGESEMDEHPYEIELGDEVEFLGDGQFGPATHLGEITAIQSRNRTARVSYLDETDWTKDGEPKKKAATVPVADLTLVRRVM
jgi:hypothetical protein